MCNTVTPSPPEKIQQHTKTQTLTTRQICLLDFVCPFACSANNG